MTDSDFRVTLLGTGVPIPRPDRFGPSTLVEAVDLKFPWPEADTSAR
jgi:hypothetical protein